MVSYYWPMSLREEPAGDELVAEQVGGVTDGSRRMVDASVARALMIRYATPSQPAMQTVADGRPADHRLVQDEVAGLITAALAAREVEPTKASWALLDSCALARWIRLWADAELAEWQHSCANARVPTGRGWLRDG